MALGTRLKQLLNERGLTVKEFANHIGIAPTTLYSFIKRDSENANIELIIKICEGLNIPINELLGVGHIAEKGLKILEDMADTYKHSSLISESVKQTKVEEKPEPTFEDVELLIARNGKKMSKEQKLKLIQMLSEIE